MPRTKKNILSLPSGTKEDVKTIKGLAEKYAGQLEKLGDEVFTWIKKHKFFVVVVAGLALFWRYWLSEQKENDDF